VGKGVFGVEVGSGVVGPKEGAVEGFILGHLVGSVDGTEVTGD